MEQIDVRIENCNNINSASVGLKVGRLNVKFAPNGTGKSTIARAIVSKVKGENLDGLLPFYCRGANVNKIEPKVVGGENFKSVMCFDEGYVEKFVFMPDELVANSFNVFIRTADYLAAESAVECLVVDVKRQFQENLDLNRLIKLLTEMGGAFKITKTGIDKKSVGAKGLSKGNIIQHVPEGLESFAVFIQSDKGVDWVAWQTEGNDFVEISDNCPFCTSDVAKNKELIKRVGVEYDKNVVKNLVSIVRIMESLGCYFSESVRKDLLNIASLKKGLEKEHEQVIVNVKSQIDNFVLKCEKLRNLSSLNFGGDESVADVLESCKLDFRYFPALDSHLMKEAVSPINNSLTTLAKRARELEGLLRHQNNVSKKLVKKHQEEINNFLEYAGYRYRVEIVGRGEKAQLKLKHVDCAEYIKGGDQHLSFGERNAFALVLFMYECLSKKPDLVILDDPISSFDKNKKYAIIEMLFRRDAASCLKGKTVLMLTHDVDPIIDMVKSLYKKFKDQICASFLKLSNGLVSEVQVKYRDVKVFADICNDVLRSEKDDIVKMIYLRRKLEVSGSKGDAYEVISNVLHKRIEFIDSREDDGVMSGLCVENGIKEIVKDIPTFSVEGIVRRICDVDAMKSLYFSLGNGYEKLQVFRLIAEVKNSVIRKFVNEVYHVENEYICQLDPSMFDTVPEYVILECNKILTDIDGGCQ